MKNKLKGTVNLESEKVKVCHIGYVKADDIAVKQYVVQKHNNMAYVMKFPHLNAIGFQFHPEGLDSTKYMIENFIKN